MAVPPPPEHGDDKPALRRRLRERRAAFVASMPPAALAAATRAIAARIAPLTGAGAIAGYVAHRGEPDVLAALLAAHGRGQPTALPRIVDGAMRFVAWHPDATLTPGHAGIAEPADGAALPVATLLVPLIGFDRAGARIGQGGGHYDRWLAAHRGVCAIGVAWSVQEVARIRADPWDMPLDLIVTERETIAP